MKTKLFTAIFLLTIVFPASVFAGPVEDGKAIFMTRCAACHNVNKAMTGPALAGIHERRTEDWIIKFVRSSQSMVKAGDKDANALFEKFNRVPMPDHPDLTTDHVKSIIEYIKSESKEVATDIAPFAEPSKRKEKYLPLTIQHDYPYFIVYLLVVMLLISTLLFVVRLKKFANKENDPA
jgi:cytochrome c551/c552